MRTFCGENFAKPLVWVGVVCLKFHGETFTVAIKINREICEVFLKSFPLYGINLINKEDIDPQR